MSEKYDVIVAGGGPSGLAAAVSAARLGARTAVIEKNGVLGGNLTSGHVGPIMGSTDKGTMTEEICDLLKVGGPQKMHDVEWAKMVLPRWVSDAGVDIYVQTQVADAIMKGNAICGLVIAGKNGLEEIYGDVVVDATGDGMAAYCAGAEYEMGRPGDKLVQPATLMFTLENVDTDRAVYCYGEVCSTPVHGMRYDEYCIKAHEEGRLPENVSVVRLYPHVNEGEVLCNTTQANHTDGTDRKDLIRAELLLREQIVQVVDFLRRYIPGYEDCRLKDSADTMGIRETRRILGEYVLTDEDVLTGARFPDVVVHNARFSVDIHNPTGGGQAEGRAKKTRPYDIPLRCLIPEKIDRMIVTGRCISGTHRAHASYRVMKIAIPLGQAAGIAAALSAKKNVLPRELPAGEVQKVLLDSGVILFD